MGSWLLVVFEVGLLRRRDCDRLEVETVSAMDSTPRRHGETGPLLCGQQAVLIIIPIDKVQTERR